MKSLRNLTFAAIAIMPLASHGADLGSAKAFNAFVFGTASLNGGHSDGAIAVGGAVSGSNYSTLLSNSPATVGADGHIGVYVGGSVALSDKLTINNSGNARVGGTYSGGNGITLNGGTLFQGAASGVTPSYFTDQKSYSLALSSYVLGLGGTAVNTSDANNWHIDASTALVSGSARLVTIPASALSNFRTMDIQNLLASQTLIINVVGATSVTDFGVTLNGSYNKVLWNYGGGTFNVTSRALHGSLLAPNAAVTSSQNIDGNLVANSWTNNNSAEIHFGTGTTFDGFIPQAVPEPGTWAALGLGAAAMLRRRRK